jgi:NAD(P)-dependent dehydrogenase (short-subunit alcohol dehydrogenase family)
MGLLDGKVALISGIGGGQGRAAAMVFTRECAKVFGCDVLEAECAETVELVRRGGGEITAIAPLDLTTPENAQRWIDAAVQTYGGIDVVYNNAAAVRLARIPDITPEDWRFSMRSELDIVFFPTRAAWPHLIARGGGVVINTASVAGMIGSISQGIVAHAAGKAGVMGITRQTAAEGGAHGIRAVTISPGPISSPAFDTRYGEGHPIRVELENATMLRRVGTPQEIAEVAAFFASDRASYVTGVNIPVDGGTHAL